MIMPAVTDTLRKPESVVHDTFIDDLMRRVVRGTAHARVVAR
jgi:hypothetical protein